MWVKWILCVFILSWYHISRLLVRDNLCVNEELWVICVSDSNFKGASLLPDLLSQIGSQPHGVTIFDTLFCFIKNFWFQQLFGDIFCCNLFLWPTIKWYPLWSAEGGFLSSRLLRQISNRQPYPTNVFSACTSALPTSKKKWTETSFHSGGASISEIKRYSLGYESIAQSIEGSTMFE